MEALVLLSLMIEWGADEALDHAPIDRAAASPRSTLPAFPAAPAPAPAPSPGPARAVAASAPPGRGPAAAAREMAAAAVDLAALARLVAGFELCALRDTATHPVLPSGDPAGGIAIVGEVPDEDEDRAGHPFAGRAGTLLDAMLGSIGLSRDQLLLLPLIPWRPPGNRPPSPLELAICLPFLERALLLARPAHILLMGSRPARAVADAAVRAGAGWRKPVLTGLPEGARVLAMRHPSYLLSHLPARKDAWADLVRLRLALDQAETARSITDA